MRGKRRALLDVMQAAEVRRVAEAGLAAVVVRARAQAKAAAHKTAGRAAELRAEVAATRGARAAPQPEAAAKRAIHKTAARGVEVRAAPVKGARLEAQMVGRPERQATTGDSRGAAAQVEAAVQEVLVAQLAERVVLPATAV